MKKGLREREAERRKGRGGGKGLHTVHIDLAFVMEKLQSHDLAPGLEICLV